MSQTNVEIVGQAIEIVEEGARRGDPGLAYDQCVDEKLIAADLEWKLGGGSGMGIPGVDDTSGREGWIEFMTMWSEDFDEFAVELEEILAADGDRVVALIRNHGTGKASRAAVEVRFGVIYALDAGRIVQVHVFREPDHALHVAGVGE